MNKTDCPQCNSAQYKLGYPHPRTLAEGLLELEAYPRRSGYNARLEACVCPSCGQVQLFIGEGPNTLNGPPPDRPWRGKAA